MTDFLLAFLLTKAFVEGAFKMNEFASKGSKVFPFREYPFSEGRHYQFISIIDRVSSIESVSIPV